MCSVVRLAKCAKTTAVAQIGLRGSLDAQLSPRFVSAQVCLGRNHPSDRDDATDDGAEEVGISGHGAAAVPRGDDLADDFGAGAQEHGWDHAASRPPVRLFKEGSECRGDRGKVCLLRLEQCRCREPDGPRHDVGKGEETHGLLCCELGPG